MLAHDMVYWQEWLTQDWWFGARPSCSALRKYAVAPSTRATKSVLSIIGRCLRPQIRGHGIVRVTDSGSGRLVFTNKPDATLEGSSSLMEEATLEESSSSSSEDTTVAVSATGN